MEEMLPSLPAGMSYEVLDFGLHLIPANLKAKLQQAIDASAPDFDTLLLGYGLCSMAVVGLNTRTCTVVIPRADDCIALFLGSRKAYQAQSKKEPGTYYLTKGWIKVGDSPFEENKRLIEKYGEERAAYIMHLMLKNYTRLAYIDSGQSDQEEYRQYTQRAAEKFNLRYEEIPGSDSLVRKLLYGPWDGEFVVVPPGQTIQYLDFT
jgi:hypothetical protein